MQSGCYTTHRGPVRSTYKSAQTVVSLKRSGFLPTSCVAGSHDLLTRHMEAHYSRVAAAKGRTDTGPPLSLVKCTKMKSRAKCVRGGSRRSARSTVTGSRPPSCSSTCLAGSRPSSSRADTGFASGATSTESLLHSRPAPEHDSASAHEDMGDCTPFGLHQDHSVYRPLQTLPQMDLNRRQKDSADVRTRTHCSRSKYSHLLSECEPGRSRWPLYHTPTGQLSGWIQERLTSRSVEEEEEEQGGTSFLVPPWKPAFSTNSPSLETTSPRNGSGKSERIRRRRSKSPAQKKLNKTVTLGSPLTVVNNENTSIKHDPKASHPRGATTTVCVSPTIAEPHTSPGDSNDCPAQSVAGPPPPPPPHSAVSVGQRGRVAIAETRTLVELTNALDKRTKDAKRRLDQMVDDFQYHSFASEITRDILARGVLSDSVLALVFQAHVQRNSRQLSEDRMWEKIEMIKRELKLASN